MNGLNLQAILMISVRPPYLIVITILLLFSGNLLSQQDSLLKPDRSRILFHEYVDKEQTKALSLDGRNDRMFTSSRNEEINYHVTRALVNRIDHIQRIIEHDSTMKAQTKVRYIRGIEWMLKDFNGGYRSRVIIPANLPALINAYERSVYLDHNDQSIADVVNSLPYGAAFSLANNKAFEANKGLEVSRHLVIRKYCEANPDRILFTLRQHPNLPFADSLILVAGYKYPRQLYDYASANNHLAWRIRNINDPLVKAVVSMATSNGSGQLYFPFLDNIVSGKMTIEEIDRFRTDSIQYYKLLVRTHLDYVERAHNKDTARGHEDLYKMLEKKAREVFVNRINGLHDEPDAIRFRIIQPLTAEELYYLAVSTDGIIYTSSFVKGVYPLMMKKSDNRGDQLLMNVKFDKYRKLIKMTAGYNMLADFLKSFPNQDDANTLMRAFVGNLEKSGGLEAGVDVADSYASIAETIKPLAAEMLNNVQLNYLRAQAKNDKTGMAIYNILNKLFLSADTTNRIDLTKELGIPPVYEVPFPTMTNDSGEVIMHVFFYGDKDGQSIFPGFLSLFAGSNWKVDRTNPQWVVIKSVKGKPITIFANKPLPEEGGYDEKAQKALVDYIQSLNLYPTITIHRGHSYYAGSTIEQMFPTSKIVFLGSCGGYHLIHDVLEKAPDAHIISTKQIADAPVNQPFFQLLTDKVRNGHAIEWIPFWKELDNMVTAKIFDDYIPPHKNLGAIFIKAYKIAMGEDEGELVSVSTD